MSFRFRAKILSKYEIAYFHCDRCGFLRTEYPYWLDEAYQSAVSESDTGLVLRNIRLAEIVAGLLYFYFDREGRYVDFAGGYGLFTRLMRDKGFDFYWHDRYCENILARGFEWEASSERFICEAVTAFEVLEHTRDPKESLRSMLDQFGTSTIIFSTLTYKGRPPAPDTWWYYSLKSGQHISFVTQKTLRVLGDQLGLKLYSNGWFHMYTRTRLSSYLFRKFAGRAAFVIAKYVQLRMQSRTFSDHEEIVQRMDKRAMGPTR
jgi:hypothetical protein